MNGFDLLLLLAAVVAAVGGWRLGFVRRASSWLGVAVGLGIAIILLPELVERMDLESDTAVLFTVGAVLVLLATVGQALGTVLGTRLHSGVVDRAGVHRGDSLGGAVLGVLGVGVFAWLVVPVMKDVSGWPSAAARGSAAAHFVDVYLPDPPAQITRLERQLAGGQFPEMFSGLRAAPDIPPAPTGSPIDDEMLSRLAPSAVRLTSSTCGRVQSGSGFVIAPGVLVTNAHVVAAADLVRVESADGTSASGRVVLFDPTTDLALLATDLDRPPLQLGEASVGDRGLVLGFPGGGPFAPSPFEVGERIDATGYDIYDRGGVDRHLLVLASALAPGDSGAAVIGADGSVIGVAVAVAPDRAEVAYALDVEELRELIDELDGAELGPTSTGPCL